MKFFSDKSLFRMALYEALVLSFVSTCKIMFVGERFKYGFRMTSFMSSIVAPWEMLILTEFGFALDIFFSSIS